MAIHDSLHGVWSRVPPEIVRQIRCAVEPQPGPSQNEPLDALRHLGVGFVLLDGYYMPRIAEVIAKLDIRTAPFSIIRLLDPERAKIEEETGETWNEVVERKDDGLAATAVIVR